jgi:hypothetical protein
MNIYQTPEISGLVRGNAYPGRGIVLGRTADGTRAVAAYFIMGRSANSRNRVFTVHDGEVFTEPFDASKVEDPSLIIYAALRQYQNLLIVTNGDQTDTVYDGLRAGKSFSESLESRCFEPDAPNFPPRISGLFRLDPAKPRYEMSILKSIDESGSDCARFAFSYPAKPGLGHFIHTYMHDGNPLPTFQGEPERVRIGSDIDAFTEALWESLDADNRISLYVRFIEPETGAYEERLINRNR